MHIKDLMLGTDVIFGLTVAIEAPFHVEGVLLPHERHLIDLTVTAHAAYAFFYVNAVIEIDKVGQSMDACPFERLAGFITLSDWGQHVAVRPDLGMARHTGVCGWDTSKGGILDRGMTITAVYVEPCHMMFMAEGDGLFTRHANTREIGRAHQGSSDPA